MLELAMVLLLHETPRGSHFDFMIEDPAWPRTFRFAAPPLLTWRVNLPLTDWPAAGAIELNALPPHRRAYLQYEGKLTSDRGSVRRIAAGSALVRAWSPAGGILDLRTPPLTATLALNRLTATHWRATVIK